jgi:hypothetical protein
MISAALGLRGRDHDVFGSESYLHCSSRQICQRFELVFKLSSLKTINQVDGEYYASRTLRGAKSEKGREYKKRRSTRGNTT